jgi:hypothetical protein
MSVRRERPSLEHHVRARELGPFLRTVVACWIGALVLLAFFALIPNTFKWVSSGFFAQLAHASVVSYGIVSSFVRVTSTPSSQQATENLGLAPGAYQDEERGEDDVASLGFSRLCDACQRPKFARAHHCRICNQRATCKQHHPTSRRFNRNAWLIVKRPRNVSFRRDLLPYSSSARRAWTTIARTWTSA